MLIPREELSHDFGGAAFDVARAEDRAFLAWVFNQFLYGEVTGIQCGHWLYRAPHLSAATFLARQASEELSHVRKILRILSLLGEKPAPAHPAIRFLSTGMMGSDWGDHVCMEMALGEGLVLTAFYALADTLPQPEIHRILEQALVEEERHVLFGERETRDWLARHPEDRPRLLAKALLQLLVLGRLKGYIGRKLVARAPGHPVLSQFDAFYDRVLTGFASRVERLGLSAGPLSGLSGPARAWLLLTLPLRQLASRLRYRGRMLTTTYLADPLVTGESGRSAETSTTRIEPGRTPSP
jgi:hypothetical protein